MEKKAAILLDVNQYVANQIFMSDTVSTEHEINSQNLTLPEKSTEWDNVLLLAIKANNTKLDTKFAEAKKELDSLIETIFNYLTTVSSFTEVNRSLTKENNQFKEDLL